MSGLDLAKPVGGLPMGAWIVVVGGGLGYALYSRHSASAPATTQTDAAPVDPGVGTGAVGGYVDNTTSAPTNDTAITDNASWARAVTNYLIASNYDPAVSDSAVRKYLASSALSVTEYALIKIALIKYGTPPQGLSQLPPAPPVNPTPHPTPHPAPVPPKHVPGPVTKPVAPPAHKPVPSNGAVYVIVKPGDSLSRIAARYPDPHITWQSIFNLNRSIIHDPNVIHPGMRIRVK